MKLLVLAAPLVVLSSFVVGQTTVEAQTYLPSNRMPVQDNTLGTQVTGTGNFTVDGGKSRGGNLFHSFQDFSVPTNGSVTFTNPANDRSIITRVTGGMFSDINGAINTPGANFFLINPNGAVFGTGAKLNVGGIFATSTANSLNLTDGQGGVVTFSTHSAEDAPFLAINPNVLFNVSRFNLGGGTGEIKNFGTLQTSPNQYIGLIGGNVLIDGGNVIAPGGRVELGGLSAPGAVDFIDNKVVFPAGVGRSDVSFTNFAIVDVSSVGGGNITINADNISLQGSSSILGGLSGVGTSTTFAGDIKLDAISTIVVDSSTIFNGTGINTVGNGGTISINTGSLSVKDKAFISTGTSGNGAAGKIIVNAKKDVTLDAANIASNTRDGGGIEDGLGGSIDITSSGSLLLSNEAKILTTTATGGKGNAGNISIQVDGDVKVVGTPSGAVSGIFSSIEKGATGNGGDIDINTGSLLLTDSSFVSARTSGSGSAGNITVMAKDAVILDSSNISGDIGTGGNSAGTSRIDISANTLSLSNGGRIATSVNGDNNPSLAGVGNAGNININVIKAIDVVGAKADFTSGIFSSIGDNSTGNGGIININSGSLSVKNKAFISAGTSGNGAAGKIIVNAKNDVTLDAANIASNTRDGGGIEDGLGGSIDITSSGSLLLSNEAKILTTTATGGKGNAGNISIQVDGDVKVVGTPSGAVSGIFSSIEKGATGNGGDIDINTGSLLLTDSSFVSARTSGSGSAGNITVMAKDAVILDSSNISGDIGTGGNSAGTSRIDISANTLSLSNGGRIATSVNGDNNPSLAGVGNAGNININVIKAIDVVGAKADFTSGIFSSIGDNSTGNGGIININSGSLSVKNKAFISAGTSGNGAAGKIIVNAKNDVTLDAANIASNTTDGGGFKGGPGGSIDIISSGGSLLLSNEAKILTTTATGGKGNAGNISIQVDGDVKVVGTPSGAVSGIFSSIEKGATGNGGNIDIQTGSLLLTDSSVVSARTSGHGFAGNIAVVAKDAVILDSSNISSDIEAGGNSAGTSTSKIDISASTLSLINGGRIVTNTNGSDDLSLAGVGNAGNININVSKTVDVVGATKDGFISAILSSIDKNATGNGGNIFINSGSLLIKDAAIISASTDGNGQAGTINVDATDSILISGKKGDLISGLSVASTGTDLAGRVVTRSRTITLDQGGEINARSASGNGGSVEIDNAGLLFLRHGGQIATNALGEKTEANSNGGDINIQSQFIIAIPQENSDINATAPQGTGRGGNVIISTQGVFGIRYQPQTTAASDITASAEFLLSTPGVDPGKNIGELPVTPTDASKQISQACSTTQQDNKFFVTGRGGHPPNTDDQLTSETYWQDPRESKTVANNSAIATIPSQPAQTGVGWAFDGKGNVTILASNSQTESTRLKTICPINSGKILAGGTQRK